MADNPIFSYTNRSIENSRAEGMSKIPIISRGDWTDLNPTDPGMILLDYVHALVDMVQYYQDHNALESFISTAKERVNIFRLARQLSYSIRSAKGAKVDVEFYVNEVYDATIKIPRYTTVYTNEDIRFLTTEDAYILAGQTSVVVPCVQGVLGIASYVGTGISRYSSIENAEDQKIILTQQNIDIDSIVIIDSLNRIWTPVEYITFSESTDRVYQSILNADGTITIQFGNGERGVLPNNTDIFTIQYVYSLAEEGRVGAETIVNIEEKIFDINGNVASVHVINRESTAGGSGPQSDEEITENAPGMIKAQNRAVTLSDFENLASSIDGISSAKAYDINTAPELCLYHEVKVVIMPDVGTTVNSSLIKQVHNYLSQRMIPPTNLQVLAPSDVVVDIDITVVRNPMYSEGGLEYTIAETITNYFNNRYNAIGQEYNPNELVAIVNTVPGVRYVDSITPNTTLEVPTLSVVKLGNININLM